jgi:DNA mismatch endonuclease, patch repair protein
VTDKISRKRRSANMAAIRAKNTKPEVIIRSLIHKMGYRFRLHRRDLPGCPDIVLPGRKKIVFVHGCFWHQHPDKNCKDARLPKSRPEYWLPKLERNQKRDAEALAALRKDGWKCFTIWECETRKESAALKRMSKFLKK